MELCEKLVGLFKFGIIYTKKNTRTWIEGRTGRKVGFLWDLVFFCYTWIWFFTSNIYSIESPKCKKQKQWTWDVYVLYPNISVVEELGSQGHVVKKWWVSHAVETPPQPKYLKVRKQQFCEWAEEIWLLAVLGIVFSEASVSYPLTVEPGGGVQPRLPCGCCEVLSASFVPQVNPVRLVVLGVFCGWWNRCREFNSLIQGHRMIIGCTRVQTQVWVLVHVLSRWPCLW